MNANLGGPGRLPGPRWGKTQSYIRREFALQFFGTCPPSYWPRAKNRVVHQPAEPIQRGKAYMLECPGLARWRSQVSRFRAPLATRESLSWGGSQSRPQKLGY